MTIKNKFNIGDIVYLKTDIEQHPRMVIGINVRPTAIIYVVTFGTIGSDHYEMELSSTRDTLVACGVN